MGNTTDLPTLLRQAEEEARRLLEVVIATRAIFDEPSPDHARAFLAAEALRCARREAEAQLRDAQERVDQAVDGLGERGEAERPITGVVARIPARRSATR